MPTFPFASKPCGSTNLRGGFAVIAASQPLLEFNYYEVSSIVDAPEIACSIRAMPEPDDLARPDLVEVAKQAWVVEQQVLDTAFGRPLSQAPGTPVAAGVDLKCWHRSDFVAVILAMRSFYPLFALTPAV